MLEKGLVQIYTGRGKGKTTAALGLAIRAAAWGNRVLFYQFLKPPSLHLGERVSIEKLDHIELGMLEHAWDLQKSLDDEQTMSEMRQAVGEAMKRLTTAAAERKYDIMILDEIVFCYSRNLASL